jgi:hypothetical protein
MKNEYWSTKGSAAHVSSKLPASPASGYSRPEINKVAVSIDFDDEDFVPNYSEGSSADLLANLPSGDLALPPGGSEVVDCGVSLKIPAGYRICVSSSIPGVFFNLIDSKRLKLNVFNAGEKAILRHKQNIAKIWIEPVYFFEWITKG